MSTSRMRRRCHGSSSEAMIRTTCSRMMFFKHSYRRLQVFVMAVLLVIAMNEPYITSVVAFSSTRSVTVSRQEILSVANHQIPIGKTTRMYKSSLSSTTTSSQQQEQEQNNNVDKQRLRNLNKQSQQLNPLLSLNMNLNSMSQVTGAAKRSQELLHRIHALYKEGYYDVSPDIVSYNTVLKNWKENNNPEKALELLQSMILQQQQQQQNVYGTNPATPTKLPSSIQVDVISFNTVIAAFAKQGNYPKTMEILREMQTNEQYPNPDTITYNIVLYSLAQSHDIGTASKAENLLREMMKQSTNYNSNNNNNNPSGVSVDTWSFNTVIYAWLKERNYSDYNDNDYNQKNTPNSIQAGIAQRVYDLLQIMEDLSKAGNNNVQPDIYTYTTCIQAMAKCGQLVKAQQILQRMTIRGLRPNRITYTALMSAYSKNGQPEKAEKILKSVLQQYDDNRPISSDDDDDNHAILEMKPDTVAFSSVIDGWAIVSSPEYPDAATRALELYEVMQQRTNDGMGPNAQTLSSVLTALAKTGSIDAGDIARKLLLEMEDEYNNATAGNSMGGNNHPLQTTTIQYNACLNAYAKSRKQIEKATKAQKLLMEMKNHPRGDCHPDIISYNTVLDACASSFGNRTCKQRAFTIAFQIFKTIMESHKNNNKSSNVSAALQPTSTTFVQFLKATRRLLPTEQQKSVLKKTLQLCMKMGMVNHVVVKQAQTACNQSETLWKEVASDLADYVNSTGDLRKSKGVPKEWTRNARR